MQRFRSIIFISAALIAVMSFSISQSVGEQPTGGIDGVIKGAEEGEIVAGASVSLTAALLKFSTVTDRDGSFSLSGVPTGTDFALIVSKDGYRTTAFKVSVKAGERSKKEFALISRYLKLLYPNGGERIFAGSEVPLKWESVGIKTLKLEFSMNGGRNWMHLVDSVDAAPGRFIWEVDDIPSPHYKIRISDTGDSGLSDESDGVFNNSSM